MKNIKKYNQFLNEEISSNIIRPIEEIMSKKYPTIDYDIIENINKVNPRWFGMIENSLMKEKIKFTENIHCLSISKKSKKENHHYILFNEHLYIVIRDVVFDPDPKPIELRGKFDNLEDAIDCLIMQNSLDDFELFESINNDYNKLLLNSAKDGDLNGVKKALLNDANLDIQNIFGYTALIYASHYGYTRIAKYLIDNKANLDIQNNAGDTALILASLYGQTEIAKYLIDNGANLDIQNNNGYTALRLASYNGRIEICKLIATKILQTQPYRAHELLKYLTNEQKQQYKEFIVANRDFNIFETKK